MRRTAPLSALSMLALAVATAFVLAACGKQGEGERCSSSNGNLDCDDNLVCTGKICCPQDRALATVEACKPSTTTDSGTDSSTDAASETSAETSADSTSDVSEAGDTAVVDSGADATEAGDTASEATSDATEAG